MNEATADTATGPQRRSRGLLLIGLVLLALVVVGLWLAFRSPPARVQGMAEADTVNVAAKITARLAALKVHEGEQVQAGQLLFELDSPEVVAKERQANAVLDAARATSDKAEQGARSEEIRAAEASWRQAQAGAELATSTLVRVERLYAEGVMTRQKRDEVQAQARSSQQLLKAARAQYDMALAGARPQDKSAAGAQVRQAEGGVAEVEISREETRGRAPQAGEISKRMANLGELVPAGYPVFSLVDIDNLWVAANLRESELKGVGIGSRIHAAVPALGVERAEFEVYFINPAGDYATWRATRGSSGYDVRSFEVRLRPLQPLKGFRPGMSVLLDWPRK